MPVTRPAFVVATDFRCSTALGTVLVALMAVSVPTNATAQDDRAIFTGTDTFVNGAASGFEIIEFDNNADITFDGMNNGFTFINVDSDNDDGTSDPPAAQDTIINNGMITVVNGPLDVDHVDQETPQIENAGTFTASDTGSLTGAGAFINTGTATLTGDVESLTVSDGTVNVGSGPAGAHGTLFVSGNTVVADDVSGAATPILAIGDNVLDTTGTVTVGDDGGGTQAGTITIGASGVLTGTGGISIQDDGQIDNSTGAGAINGNVTLTGDGSLLHTGGGTLTGDVTVADTSTFALAGIVDGNVDGGTTTALGGANSLDGQITGTLTAGSATLTDDLTVGGTVDIENGLDVGGLLLDATGQAVDAGTVTIADGGQIIADTVTMEDGGANMDIASSDNAVASVDGNVAVTGAGSGVDVDGTALITGDLTVADGNVTGVNAGGDTLDVGGVLDVTGNIDAIAVTADTVVIDDGVNQTVNGGTVTAQSSYDVEDGNGVNSSTLAGLGAVTFDVSEDGDLTIDADLALTDPDNDDVNVIETGTLTINTGTPGEGLSGVGVFTQDGAGTQVTVADGQVLSADTFNLVQGTMNVGVGSSLVGTGNTVTVGGGAMVMDLNIADNGDITDNGNLEILDNGEVNFAASGEINVDEDNSGGAAVTIAAAEATVPGSAAGALNLNGADGDIVTIGGGGAANDVTVAVTNDGILNVGDATLTEATGDIVTISGAGQTTIGSDGEILVTDFDVDDGGSADIDGQLDVDETSTVTVAGSVNLSGSITASDDTGPTPVLGTVEIADGTGSMTVDGAGALVQGNLTNNETLTVDAGATLEVSETAGAGALADNDGATLTNNDTLNASGDVTADNFVNADAATATFDNGADLTVTNNLDNEGAIDMAAGGDLTVDGTLDNLAGATPATTLTVGTGNVDVGGLTTNEGTITLGTTGTATLNGLDNQDDGSFTADRNVTFEDAVTNAGDIEIQNAGTLDVEGTFDNETTDSTLTVGTGDVDIDGLLTNAGTVDLGAAAGISTINGLDNDGTFEAERDVTFEAGVTNSDDFDIQGGGDLVIDGTLDNDTTGATFDVATGTVDINGLTTNEGAITFGANAAAATLLGGLDNGDDATFTADRSVTFEETGAGLNDAVVTNSGDIDITSAGNLLIQGSLDNETADSTLNVATGTVTVTGETTNTGEITMGANATDASFQNVTNEGSGNIEAARGLDIDGNLTNNNTITTTGTDGDVDVDGVFDNTGGTLSVSGNLALDTGGAAADTLTNDGTITMTGADGTGFTIDASAAGNPALLDNNGTITLGAADLGVGAASALNVDNTGAMSVNTGGVISANDFDNNSGGSLDILGTGSMTADSFDQVDATADIDGSLSLNAPGTITNDADSSIDLSGTLSAGAGGTIENQGAITADGDSAAITGNVVNQTDGAGGGLVQADEDLAITGNLTNQQNATVTVADAANVTVSGLLENDGIVNVNGTGTLEADGATSNTADGDMTIEGTLTINNTPFDNAGLVTVDSGTVEIDQPAGVINNTGTFDLNGTASVEGTGTLTFNNQDNGTDVGTLNVAANSEVDGDVNNAGTMDMDGTITGNLDNTGDNASTIAGTVDGTLDNSAVATGATIGLTVDGALEVGGGAGTLANTGELDVNNNIDGSLSNTGANAVATLAGNVTGNLDNNADATLTVDGASTVDGTVINNTDANMDIASGGNLAVGTGDLDNDGALTFNGGTVTGTVDNDGALDAETGTSTVTGAINNATNVTIDTGARLNVDGDLINEAGASANINGTLGGNLDNLTAGASADINGTVTGDVDNSQTINLAGTVDGDFDNIGAAANLIIDGLATVGGTLTNDGGGTVDVQDLRSLDVDLLENVDGELIIDGTINGDVNVNALVRNDGTLNMTGGVINGTLENNTTGVVTTTNSNSINNLENDGDLTVDTGTLLIDNTALNTGTLTVDAGATLNMTGGTLESAFINTQTDIDGRLTGSLLNRSFAVANVTGDVTGTVTNQTFGELTITATGTAGALENEVDSEATVLGNIDNAVTNAGNLTMSGNTGGTFLNQATGTADLSGDVGGQLRNEGTLDITGDVVAGGSTLNLDAGEMDIASGTTLTTPTLFAQGTGTVTNEGTIDGNVDITDGTAATVALISGTVTGDADIAGDGRLSAAGASAINGDVSNAGGTFAVTTGTATVGGTVTSADGVVTVSNGATLDAAGPLAASSGAVIDVDGTLGVGATLSGGSELAVAGLVSGNVRASGNSDILVEDGAEIDGDVTMSGGNLTIQDPAGQPVPATIAGAGTVTGDVTTTGTDVVQNGNVDGNVSITGGSFELSGDIGGTLDVMDTDTLVSGPSVVTGAATLSDGLDLDSRLSVASLSVGGDFDLADGARLTGGDAVIGGTSTLGAGTITNDITFNGDVNATAGLDLTGTATSTQAFNATGNVAYSGNFVNQGSFAYTGNTASFGSLTNSGTFSTQDGTAVDNVTVNGAFTTTDGVFNMDIDLENGAESADTFTVVGGPATGTGVVNFNDITDTTADFTDGSVLVFDLDQSQANDLNLVGTGLPTSGALAFIFREVTPDVDAGNIDDGDWAVIIGSNPAIGGIAGGIALTQSLIGSVINRPSSPFVAGLAAADEDPCGVGMWSRATGGAASTVGESSSRIGTFESEVDATYAGLQIGGDYACFDGFYNGWDLAFGGILGLNTGTTEQLVFDLDTGGNLLTNRPPSSVTETDFQQTYLGAYVAAARGPLLADLQFRIEDTTFDISNRGINGGAPIGLNDQEFDVSAYTLSGSVSYAKPINEELGITFIPTAGFSYTKSQTDTLSFADGSRLEIEDSTTEIAFIGATITRTVILPDEVSAINYFATGTVYNDFSDGVTSTYFSALGTEDETRSSSLGTYGELSLGLNYTRILQPGAPLNARQINGSVRLDGRTGSDIDSWGLTAQFRVQF